MQNLSAEVGERPEILETSIVQNPLELITQEEVDTAYFAATGLAPDGAFDCLQAPTNAPIQVPTGTCVWWVMRIQVTNLYPEPLKSVIITDYYAAELNLQVLEPDPGQWALASSGSGTGLLWCVTGDLGAGECENPPQNRLSVGSEASLFVLAFTGLGALEQQEYTSQGTYQLDYGAELQAFRMAETVLTEKDGTQTNSETRDEFTEETDAILIEAYAITVAPIAEEVIVAPTPTPTAGLAATSTPTPTGALAPTSTPTPTGALAPTYTPTPTAALAPTSTPTPSAALTPTSTPPSTPTSTPTSTAALTPTFAPTAITTPTPSGCIAGDTGFLNPAAQAADTGGDGDGFELAPHDAFADGGGFATNNDGSRDRHRYFNYAILLPEPCAVAGIEVRLDWWLSSTDRSNSMRVELSWDGGQTWTAPKEDTQETTSQHTATLGGPGDTWGRSWTQDELSNANFRVRLTGGCSGSGCDERDFFLDWAPLKVYVAAPTPTPTPSPTPTATATSTPTPTAAATATATTTPTPPPAATSTPPPTPTAKPAPTASPTPVPTPTASPTPTPEASP